MAQINLKVTSLLIDTNIFLEFLLNQNRAQESEKLLVKVESGEIKGVVTTFTLHSLEVILYSTDNQTLLISFLEKLRGFIGLTIYATNLEEELEIARLVKEMNLDFDDNLQYFVAKKLNLTIVSFDKHFDKTDLGRKEPIDILQLN